MADKKPTLELWSVRQGKLVDFEVSIDGDEIVAVSGDESLKFPGGLTKKELLELAEAHNEANKDVKAITDTEIKAKEDLDAANRKLLEDLK